MTTSTIAQDPFKFTQARIEALPFLDALYKVKDSEQPGLRCFVYPKGKKYPDGLKALYVSASRKGQTARST